jgi:hypothetical protein
MSNQEFWREWMDELNQESPCEGCDGSGVARRPATAYRDGTLEWEDPEEECRCPICRGGR